MTSTFDLRFADGYGITVLSTFDEMLGNLDTKVQKHGDCVECIEEVS